MALGDGSILDPVGACPVLVLVLGFMALIFAGLLASFEWIGDLWRKHKLERDVRKAIKANGE